MLQNIGEAPLAAPGADLIADTTTQTFVKDVIEESKIRPVLVDFWAPWCGPCKQLTPLLEKVVKAAKGKIKLVKMNIDEHPPIFQQISQQMGIQSIPAVLAFVNGQPIDGFLGALPEKQITEFVERMIKDRVGGEEKDALAAADAALAAKDYAGAADLYAQVLAAGCQQHPGAGRAGALLSRHRQCRAGQEDARHGAGSKARRFHRRCRARRDRTRRADQGSGSDRRSRGQGRRRSEGLSGALRSRAGAQCQRQPRGAIDHLLEIVQRDRKWNDDGARKQLVQLFDAWGPTDEATLEGRKRLSSVLFA